MGRWLVVGLLALAVTACGEDDGESVDLPETFEEACAMVPGCEQSSTVDLGGPTQSVVRVGLSLGADGVPVIAQMEAVDVLSEVGKPTETLGGSHVLVAVDAAGNWLEVHPLDFPTSLLSEDLDSFLSEELPLEPGEARTTAYFDPSNVARFEVLDAQGTKVAEAPFVMARSFRVAAAAAGCRHLALLEAGDEDWVPVRTLDRGGVVGGLVDPGPLQRAVVQAAFNRMTPTLCHAVQRIGFALADNPSLGGFVDSYTAGDLVVINVGKYSEASLVDREQQIRMMGTITHEAGHAAEAMLEFQGEPMTRIYGRLVDNQRVVGGWSFEAESRANEHVQNLRLMKGITEEWLRMQDAFVGGGFGTSPYFGKFDDNGCGSEIQFYTAQLTTEAGFMSRYGGTNQADDVADMVAMPMMAPLWRAEGVESIYEPADGEGCGNRMQQVELPEDSACRIFRMRDQNGIPIALAAAYTKLRMVYELDLITREAFEECVGQVSLDVPGPGFHIYQDDVFRRSIEQNVEAIIGTDQATGGRVFVMTADGQASFDSTEYDATMKLTLSLGPSDVELDQTSWPRGGYVLQGLQSAFSVEMPDAPAGNFESTQGFVLITASSNELIEGSVVLQQAMRWQAPVPVPQVFDPPLVVRFTIQN